MDPGGPLVEVKAALAHYTSQATPKVLHGRGLAMAEAIRQLGISEVTLPLAQGVWWAAGAFIGLPTRRRERAACSTQPWRLDIERAWRASRSHRRLTSRFSQLRACCLRTSNPSRDISVGSGHVQVPQEQFSRAGEEGLGRCSKPSPEPDRACVVSAARYRTGLESLSMAPSATRRFSQPQAWFF